MQEREMKPWSGWMVFVGMIAWLVADIIYFINIANSRPEGAWPYLLIPILILSWLICLFGFRINNPNNALIVQLFGAYRGTIKEVGFFWVNPFSIFATISLRVRTFETEPLKVNDKDGTPIEIAAVVVWKVIDTFKARFEIDNYENFVKIQSDAALRTLASRYSYDAPEIDSHSLRGHIDEVANQLKNELHLRMQQAGVEVQQARISKLAYAQEIAAAMLQRQQAGAVVAARAKIVEGAVGMVEHALAMLKEKNILELDPERKAAMVCNLLVVLCGHSNPQPVLNTGTLHN